MHYGQALALSLAFIAGAALPLQAGANAELGRALGHPLSAALFSALVALAVTVPVLLVFKAPLPALELILRAPAWSWIGGLMGVSFLILAILAAPKIGAATFIATAVAGQMAVSVFVDHYALLGFAQREASPMRLFGVVLVVLGVVMVQFAQELSRST